MSTDAHVLEAKGFLRSLFDFSFSTYVADRVIRILYILITVVYSLGALVAFIVLLAARTPADIFAALILIPLAYLIYLTVARIGLEVLIVVFRIGEDVRELRDLARARPHGGGPGVSAP